MFELGPVALTLNYRLVFLTAMYEPHYIGSLDPLEQYKLD